MAAALPYADAMAQTVPLSSAPVGVRLVLASSGPAPQATTPDSAARVRRLAQLGLRPGVELICVMRTSGGGRVVSVAGARIALDHATAASLLVALSEGTNGPCGSSTSLVG